MASPLQVKVKVAVMAKDEEDILPYFLEYYGALFGFSNIHIADNFSTNKEYLSTLRKYQKKGVIVKWKADGFTDKGNYLLKWMKKLYPAHQADFILFVDIDEFVVFSSGENADKLSFSSNKNKILAELTRLKGEYPSQPSFRYRTWAFGRQTKLEYSNVIKEQFYFSNFISESEKKVPFYQRRNRRYRKLFFNPALTQEVQQGFHDGTGSKTLVVSNLSLLHYHYRSVSRTISKAWKVLEQRGYPKDLAVIRRLFEDRHNNVPSSPHKMELLLRYHDQGAQSFLQGTEKSMKTTCIYQALKRLGVL